jgi:Glycosyltransferase family 18
MIRGLYAPTLISDQRRKNRIVALCVAALVLLQFRFPVATLSDGSFGFWPNSRAVVPDSQWLVRSSMRASFSSSTRYQCAPWLTRSSQRKVAFIDLATMNAYYRRKGIYRGGEFYMSACLDYALRQNGFSVHRLSAKSLLRNGDLVKVFSKYHRLIANGSHPWKRLNVSSSATSGTTNGTLEWSTGMCKLRSFAWWGNVETKREDIIGLAGLATRHDLPFDPKQWLKPYPTADFFNTFLGFFPHSVLLQKTPPSAFRGKVGMLLGKVPTGFNQIGPVVDALLLDGFELHSTCPDCTMLPSQVIRHEKVGPGEYIELLKSCAFLLGTGYPYDSPSPFEGLANGVAFLNPIAVGALPWNETSFPLGSGPGWRATQHVPLSMVGMPYVYNVHLSNATQVVTAANHAVQYRFASFVPSDFRPLSMITRVCSMLEDDSLCLCPPKQGHGHIARQVNCQGSSTIRKPSTGDDANFVGDVSFLS